LGGKIKKGVKKGKEVSGSLQGQLKKEGLPAPRREEEGLHSSSQNSKSWREEGKRGKSLPLYSGGKKRLTQRSFSTPGREGFVR